MSELSISIVGDSALNIVFSHTLDPTNGSRTYDPAGARRVRHALRLLNEHPIPGVIGCTPAYCALTIYYDPLTVGFDNLVHELNDRLSPLDADMEQWESEGRERSVIEVPVCYGGEFGPDLLAVAQACNQDVQEVIARHSAPTYDVGMMGYYPGFAYLTGLDQSLYVPRNLDPSKEIPAGSIGIGGRQTGIYGLGTPGDWNIIGRTPLKLLEITNVAKPLLEVGQGVKLVPISPEEYEDIATKVAKGTYEPHITRKEVQQ
ncbi:MAG: 5-oxoprolinase subunit PxpB [Coriobacteriia bacterium]|nr:5-oxoprolinase subunit PxpB [Coriobacteriia bacterium]